MVVRRPRSFLSVCLIASACIRAEPPAHHHPGPHLSLPAPVHDFGLVYRGDRPESSLPVVNAGTGTLSIDDVRSPCGCTASVLSSRLIPPGRETTITIALDTDRLSGEHVRQTVKLYSNDPEHRIAELTVMATIRDLITVTPPTAAFGRIAQGTTPSKSVRILPNDGAAFRVTEVFTRPAASVSVTYEPLRSQSVLAEYDVEVRLSATAASGPLSENVLLFTDHPRRPFLKIPVRAYVEPPVEIQPHSVSFGRIPRGQSREEAVTIINHDPVVHLEIRDLHLDHNCPPSQADALRARLEPIEQGKKYLIVITASADISVPYFHGTLTFATNHPELRHAKVPFHGFIVQHRVNPGLAQAKLNR